MVSPYNLVQEQAVGREPRLWRLLTACCLLNRTDGAQVRPMVDEFWRLCGTPEDALRNIDSTELLALLKPLGLYNRRLRTIGAMADDILLERPIAMTAGVGDYALASIKIFLFGETDVRTPDPWLNKYLEWKREHDSLEAAAR